ncbi:9011_t:CDS:1, partial [Gigaspora rosea]
MQSEIDSLWQRITEFEARNAELMKQMMEENNRRDARIEKLEQQLDKLEKESESEKNRKFQTRCI